MVNMVSALDLFKSDFQVSGAIICELCSNSFFLRYLQKQPCPKNTDFLGRSKKIFEKIQLKIAFPQNLDFLGCPSWAQQKRLKIFYFLQKFVYPVESTVQIVLHNHPPYSTVHPFIIESLNFNNETIQKTIDFSISHSILQYKENFPQNT